jgi:uncharacterized protein YaeQ
VVGGLGPSLNFYVFQRLLMCSNLSECCWFVNSFLAHSRGLCYTEAQEAWEKKSTQKIFSIFTSFGTPDRRVPQLERLLRLIRRFPPQGTVTTHLYRQWNLHRQWRQLERQVLAP